MLKSKTFVKKTRKGNVLKVVREHYLRDDVWCGANHCTNCGESENNVLDSVPQSLSSQLCDYPHYIIPDTNVVLHQIDVLEDPVFKNVILLQTVLEEVKNLNLGVYKRVRSIISDPGRKFFVFSNEHHRQTYIERERDESSNDRNDRAIRTAASWYNDHLKDCEGGKDEELRIRIVLITNDRANKNKAIKEGISAFKIQEYVSSLDGCGDLVDRLANLEHEEDKQSVDGKRKQFIFPEHLPLVKIHAGVKSGKYKQGVLHGSRENYLEAVVYARDSEDEIFIQGLENLNRAVHEDIVAIEILPKDKWTGPSSVVLEDFSQGDEEEVDGIKLNNTKQEMSNLKKTGRVVGIIKRNWRPYCGVISPSGNTKGSHHLFIAAERRIPRIKIVTRQAETLKSQRIVVSIDSWPRTSRYPLGHFVRKLGDIGEKATENELLLLEHDVPHLAFSASVQKDLPTMPWTITQEDLDARLDLRGLSICSVDPPGCTDIDDALHWKQLDNGNYEVGVHIADVTHFIRPGTAIDDEACNRGTTVYLTDQRIDMVPGLLSSDLCSLRSNVDRLAFSCIWELTPSAEIINTKFTKSVICSKASLTYAEAQLRIDDSTQNDAITVSLRHLNELAKILKRRRIEHGALTLASTEVRFHIDSETHDPIDVETKQLRDTNSLVEEFMLLANISVAKKTHEHFPEFAVLRRHPSPPPSNYDILIKAARSKGLEIKVDTAKDLAVSLDTAVIPDEPYFNTMLRILTTRCMMEAVYFCSGMLPEDQYHHYGLATPIYTHFTSPIRRYSDVLVHRLLAVAIGAMKSYPNLLNKEKVQKQCNHLNHRHKMAQYAGRASVDLHTQLFFKSNPKTEDAFVMFIRKNALQVLIPKYGLQGTVYMNRDGITDSHIVFNEEEPSLTVGNVKFCMFDKVTLEIKVEKTATHNSFLQFTLLSPKPCIDDETIKPSAKKARLK